MSMRILCATVLAAALLAAGPADSQVVDLSTITCKDLFEGPKERVSYILTWLNAYYRNDESPPVIDFDKMKADSEKLGAYCQKNPTVGIITAADKVLDK